MPFFDTFHFTTFVKDGINFVLEECSIDLFGAARYKLIFVLHEDAPWTSRHNHIYVEITIQDWSF